MSWLDCLLILVFVYLAVVVGRGIAQFVSWCSEEFFARAREARRLAEKPEGQRHENDSAASPASSGHRKASIHHGSYQRRILVSVARFTLAHWLAALAGLARRLVSSKRYDYWVAAALGEEYPGKKAEASVEGAGTESALRPPAWGLKADALLTLQRYDEALACFDKILELDPSAMLWYQKGLCCLHLKRYEEAANCFDKTLAACSDKEYELRGDALRKRTDSPRTTSRRHAERFHDQPPLLNARAVHDSRLLRQKGLRQPALRQAGLAANQPVNPLGGSGRAMPRASFSAKSWRSRFGSICRAAAFHVPILPANSSGSGGKGKSLPCKRRVLARSSANSRWKSCDRRKLPSTAVSPHKVPCFSYSRSIFRTPATYRDGPLSGRCRSGGPPPCSLDQAPDAVSRVGPTRCR